MSPKRALVQLVITLIATGAAQNAWARPTQKTSLPAPKAGEPVDFQANTHDHDGDNPYSVITSQNAFRLVPAPPPPAPVAPPDPVTQANIKLTGLVQVAGQRPRAMFVSTPKNPKDIAYYNLSEGERQDNLELVKILDSQEAAEVINAGMRVTIYLKDSKPVVAPGAVPPPAASAPAPMQMASIVGGGGQSGSGQPGLGVMMAGAEDPNIQTRPLRASPQEPPPSIDETHIMMAADALQHQDEIAKGDYPPVLPPIQKILDGKEPDAEDEPSETPNFPGQ